MKISGESIIYKIVFSQTRSESRHQMRMHVKMWDHISNEEYDTN